MSTEKKKASASTKSSTTTTTIRIDPTLQRTKRNVQYYRYSKDERRERQAWHLLEREDLTAAEIIRFCHGGGGGHEEHGGQDVGHEEHGSGKNHGRNIGENVHVVDDDDDLDDGTTKSTLPRPLLLLEERDPHQLAYRARRREIQRRLESMPSGGAWIDGHGRLLPVVDDDDDDAHRGPPLPPLPALNNNNNNAGAGGNQRAPAPPLPPQQQQQPQGLVPPPHNDAAWRREAAAAIDRAVERYRRAGVNIESSLQLIRLDVRVDGVPPLQQNNPLTVRRILIAVAAVVLAFVCMLIQTLGKPNNGYTTSSSSSFHNTVSTDPLPRVVLQQRDFMDHVLQCHSPTNRTRASSSSSSSPAYKTWPLYRWWWRLLLPFATTKSTRLAAAGANADHHHQQHHVDDDVDCGDGVLLISSVQNMIRAFSRAQSAREVLAWEPYIVPAVGLNATWWLDCADDAVVEADDDDDTTTTTSNESSLQCSLMDLQQQQQEQSSPPSTTSSSESSQCRVHPEPTSACFRGVHDALITEDEVRAAIRLGQHLIDDRGGDHFDIHDDIALLRSRVPTILTKLQSLLRTEYRQPPPRSTAAVQPVAFRVYAAGPMSGDGVRASHLASLLNRSNYRHWMEQVARRNKLARHFPVPWPLTVFHPVRETCNVLADRQVDDAFRIHTTVFLSDDELFTNSGDGLTLFVDEIKDVVTRGLAVESTVGRIVLSSTGHENRRCRLPTRSGVRAALQIWWS